MATANLTAAPYSSTVTATAISASQVRFESSAKSSHQQVASTTCQTTTTQEAQVHEVAPPAAREGKVAVGTETLYPPCRLSRRGRALGAALPRFELDLDGAIYTEDIGTQTS